jgi:hypothetical protein
MFSTRSAIFATLGQSGMQILMRAFKSALPAEICLDVRSTDAIKEG